jgi:hypothetical protein
VLGPSLSDTPLSKACSAPDRCGNRRDQACAHREPTRPPGGQNATKIPSDDASAQVSKPSAHRLGVGAPRALRRGSAATCAHLLIPIRERADEQMSPAPAGVPPPPRGRPASLPGVPMPAQESR